VELVFVDWLIGERRQDLPGHVRRLSTFPVPRYMAGFDLAVSAAGYNSFHELLSLAVPTVFVPNENPMMDAQEARAAWAERQGAAFCVRRHDPYRMAWALKALLEPARRAEVSERCRALPPCDGAGEVARLVEGLASSVRLPGAADRSPHALTRA
jgi:UDP:flavonoid glycosyltransferase YjiC (YdhE family)